MQKYNTVSQTNQKNDYLKIACHSALLLCIFSTALSHAETDPQYSEIQAHTFSYTLINMEEQADTTLSSLREKLLPKIMELGAKNYAIWIAVDKPDDAPFAGLEKNQIGLMLVWPNKELVNELLLDETLESMTTATSVSTRTFQSIYLPGALKVPTYQGFYVHREEHYKLEDVSEAIRLSKEAWKTWEPKWGTKVIGLFREISSEKGYVNLNRIVWYPSYAAWMETRNFTQDPQSARRFRDRRKLLIEGSGVAIATDRALP